MVSVERLNEVLVYNSDTGSLAWKKHWKNTPDGLAGCFRKDGYRVIRVDDVLLYAHRIVWAMHKGEYPKIFIDHINGMRGDNRIENLRDVSVATNSRNERKARSSNKSSQLLGVQRNHSAWQACITTNGIRKCLGTFKTPEEAHRAYLEAKRKMHDGCTI